MSQPSAMFYLFRPGHFNIPSGSRGEALSKVRRTKPRVAQRIGFGPVDMPKRPQGVLVSAITGPKRASGLLLGLATTRNGTLSDSGRPRLKGVLRSVRVKKQMKCDGRRTLRNSAATLSIHPIFRPGAAKSSWPGTVTVFDFSSLCSGCSPYFSCALTVQSPALRLLI
jgi:hypothetical protein